jgi:hypothetical protein
MWSASTIIKLTWTAAALCLAAKLSGLKLFLKSMGGFKVSLKISISTNRPTTTDQRSEPPDRNALRHACGAAVAESMPAEYNHIRLKEHEMDLEKQTRIIPASTNSVGSPTGVSLFDAVRKWTDAEGADDFYIELDGKRLLPEQIQAIAHSEAYKNRLLAFNERLA